MRVPASKRPSYEVLNMAFGLGAGTFLFDKSRYHSHGAITTATWAAGLHGYCLDFNAANPDYVRIPAANCPQINFTTEDFSFITRIYPHSVANTFLIEKSNSGATHGYLLHLSAGLLWFYTYQGVASQITFTAVADALLINTHYTIGVSRTGASVRIYINGVDVTSGVGVHIDPRTSPTDFVLGEALFLGAPHDGQVEFLRFFRNIALLPSEHLAWHNFLA